MRMTREKDMAKGDIRAVAEEEFAIGAPHSDHSSHGALGTCIFHLGWLHAETNRVIFTL